MEKVIKVFNGLCVRRLMGVAGFLASIVAIFAGITHEALQLLMITSATLLGITTLDSFIKQSNG